MKCWFISLIFFISPNLLIYCIDHLENVEYAVNINDIGFNITSSYFKTSSFNRTILEKMVRNFQWRLKCDQSELEGHNCSSDGCMANNNILEKLNIDEINQTNFLTLSKILLYIAYNAPFYCGNKTFFNDMEKFEKWNILNEFQNGIEFYGFTKKIIDNVKYEDHHDVSREHDDHDTDDEEVESTNCFNAQKILYLSGLKLTDFIGLQRKPMLNVLVAYLLTGIPFNEYNCNEHNLPYSSDFNLALFKSFSKKPNEKLVKDDLQQILNNLEIGIKTINNEVEHDHDHEDRHKREANQDFVINKNCISNENLFEIFNVESGVDVYDFEKICPALIQQRLSNVCKVKTIEITNKVSIPSQAERYGYGFLSITIISGCALLGGLFHPLSHSAKFHYVLDFFVASGFGAMTTDALLHLIPESLGLHDHSSESINGPQLNMHSAKFLGILAAIYAFFILELCLSAFVKPKSINDKESSISEECDIKINGIRTDLEINEVDTHAHTHTNMTSTSLMVVIGDGVHNFADGLIIGAAFTVSITSGISTSLAVFVHELAHEFGDFALLIHSGLSIKKALLLNGLSAITCFIGLFIGLSISINESVRQWIFSIAAGMFLYIAISNMVPEMVKTIFLSTKKFLVFFILNSGALSAIAILTLLSVYEESIKV